MKAHKHIDKQDIKTGNSDGSDCVKACDSGRVWRSEYVGNVSAASQACMFVYTL